MRIGNDRASIALPPPTQRRNEGHVRRSASTGHRDSAPATALARDKYERMRAPPDQCRAETGRARDGAQITSASDGD